MRNPIFIAIIILSLSTLFYMISASYQSNKAKKAGEAAAGAETIIEKTQKREESLKELEKEQREETQDAEDHINDRTYFDSVDRVW